MDAPTDVVDSPGPEAPPSGPRRLSRRPDDGPIAGVCAGIAEYFDIDPVIVRLAFVLFTLAGGVGILAYIVLAVVLPEEPLTTTPTGGCSGQRSRSSGSSVASRPMARPQ